MRRILLFLVLAGLFPFSTMADENNLAGGVLITHFVPRIAVRYQQDPCIRYEEIDEVNIDDASQQVCRTDEMSNQWTPHTWYVIAAFHEDKNWCGVQFGLGDYDEDGFYIMYAHHASCGGWADPTGNWPLPNSGVRIDSFDGGWEGNYRAVYYFIGYTWSGEYPTLIALTEHPEENFIGFTNCESPAQSWPARGGAVGFFMDGNPVYPVTPGACCDPDGACEVMVEADCVGEFFPEPNCDPNPCPDFSGACCFEDGSCLMMSESDCQVTGGVWQGDVSDCDPNLCPQPVRACCDESGGCTLTELDDCAGDWLPDVAACEPNPCPISANDKTSWGEIKVRYRR
jgi:hypothetical protein